MGTRPTTTVSKTVFDFIRFYYCLEIIPNNSHIKLRTTNILELLCSKDEFSVKSIMASGCEEGTSSSDSMNSESLSELFDKAFDLFNSINATQEPTNSLQVQVCNNFDLLTSLFRFQKRLKTETNL